MTKQCRGRATILAELERGMIRERVNAGLARSRDKGVRLGRRPVKAATETRIRELRAEGMGILKIGRTLANIFAKSFGRDHLPPSGSPGCRGS